MTIQPDTSSSQHSKSQRRLRMDRSAKERPSGPQKPEGRFGRPINHETGDGDPPIAKNVGQARKLGVRSWVILNSVRLPTRVTEREVSALITILRDKSPHAFYKG